MLAQDVASEPRRPQLSGAEHHTKEQVYRLSHSQCREKCMSDMWQHPATARHHHLAISRQTAFHQGIPEYMSQFQADLSPALRLHPQAAILESVHHAPNAYHL